MTPVLGLVVPVDFFFGDRNRELFPSYLSHFLGRVICSGQTTAYIKVCAVTPLSSVLNHNGLIGSKSKSRCQT